MVGASILIPVLRQVDGYLEESVRSALEQTESCEVVVVTAAATPRSNLEVLSRLQREAPGLIVIRRSRPGFAAGLNCGIERSTASRVGFLLSDDWLSATAVEDCLQHSADIVCTQKMTYAADGRTPIHRPWHFLTNEMYHSQPTLERKARYLGHFFLFQRSKLTEAGGLDETVGDTPGVDDFHLIWTLLEQRATVAIVEKPLYNYRDHPGDRLTLRDPEQMKATMRRILEKHSMSGRELEEVLASHASAFGRMVADVAKERLARGDV